MQESVSWDVNFTAYGMRGATPGAARPADLGLGRGLRRL